MLFFFFSITHSFVIGASVFLPFPSVSIALFSFFPAPLLRALGVSAALLKRSFDECLLIAWKQAFDQIALFDERGTTTQRAITMNAAHFERIVSVRRLAPEKLVASERGGGGRKKNVQS